MEVLIVDASRTTLLQIQKIVLQEIPDAKIVMAGDGEQALNIIIIPTAKFDAIITSSQLRLIPGANLLQSIWTLGGLPTLLHSNHPKGYRLDSTDQCAEVDLAECVKGFDFAQFRLKDSDFSYLPEFLLDVKINRLAKELV